MGGCICDLENAIDNVSGWDGDRVIWGMYLGSSIQPRIEQDEMMNMRVRGVKALISDIKPRRVNEVARSSERTYGKTQRREFHRREGCKLERIQRRYFSLSA